MSGINEASQPLIFLSFVSSMKTIQPDIGKLIYFFFGMLYIKYSNDWIAYGVKIVSIT